jgi:hypothetical protein
LLLCAKKLFAVAKLATAEAWLSLAGDWTKLADEAACASSLELTPEENDLANRRPPMPSFDHYAWRYHCRGLFQMPIAA